MTTQAKDYLYQLRYLLDQNCRPGQIKQLCIYLGLDYDLLPDTSRLLKLNGVIQHYARRGQLESLIGQLQVWNPHVNWPEVPSPDRQIRDQEASQQRFLDKLQELLPASKLEDARSDQQVAQHLSSAAIETLSGLDRQRKGELLKLLYDSNLIVGNSPVIRLRDANLHYVDLSWQQLPEINLSGADMFGADFSLCNLRDAHLAGANLRQAFVKAYLAGADLAGCDMREAQMSGVRLEGANLAGANLRVADLSGADLAGSNLTGADMSLANLSEANLSSADLSLARLDETNLSGTNLAGATLDQVKLNGATVEQKQLQRESAIKDAVLLASQSHIYN